MKNKLILCAVLPALLLAPSCDKVFSGGDGYIETAFLEDVYMRTRAVSGNLPDTNSFILDVRDSKGNTVYSGAYGSAPKSILTSEGSYTVCAKSREFSSPEFDAPQYGDSQNVDVRANETTLVTLLCHQLNAGIMLKIPSSFLTAYPSGSLHLRSSNGKLLYGYSEKRFAYFPPGPVSLVLSDSGTDTPLLTRNLAERDMLTLNLSVSKSSQNSSGISIGIDTTLNRSSENFTIGGSSGSADKGEGMDTAFGVGEAKAHVGEKDVWVYGYIVGGDMTSSKVSFTKPFTSRTNMAIAAKSSAKDRSECLGVQLAKGDARDALNLVDHPSNLGRTVYLKGTIVSSYYGIPGIQDITEFVLQ